MPGQGGEALARFVDELTLYLAQHPERGAPLAPVLTSIVAAQQRGDPIGLADRIEFELLPLLGGTLTRC